MGGLWSGGSGGMVRGVSLEVRLIIESLYKGVTGNKRRRDGEVGGGCGSGAVGVQETRPQTA